MIIVLLFTIIMQLVGCGNSTVTDVPLETSVNYVVKDIKLPHYTSFTGSYVVGDTLYYAASGYQELSQENISGIYKLNTNGKEAEKLLYQLDEQQVIMCMTLDDEETIYGICYTDNAIPLVELIVIDKDGVLLNTCDITELIQEQQNTHISYMAVDNSNHIMLADSNSNVFVLEADGRRLFQMNVGSTVYGMCRNESGNVFVGFKADDGIGLKEIDTKTGQLSSPFNIKISGEQFLMAPCMGASLLIGTQNGVYEYYPELGESTLKFDWITYNLSGELLGTALLPIQDSILVLNLDYNTFPINIDAVVLKEAQEGEIEEVQQTVLTLGVKFADSYISEEIINFNKANPDIKIEMKVYNDWSKLNADIITGNYPDILALPPSSMELYSKKGVVEDLNPYLDNDSNLVRSDFYENVLNAFGDEEHLYGIPITFGIYTIIGKEADLGERTSWNLDEMIAFVDDYKDESDIFEDATKSGVLFILKFANVDQLIDYNNMEKPFNRELFIKMLEFANRFKDDGTPVQNKSLSQRMADDEIMLYDAHVSNGACYQLFSTLFGESVSFVGHALENGNGNVAFSSNIFAISSKCADKEIAWNFISTLLSKEVQENIAINLNADFPIRKDAMEMQFSNMKNLSRNYGYADFVYRSEGINDEEAQKVRELISRVDTCWNIDIEISDIMEEEAGSYFSGAKTVEEVADIVEGRVNVYVNEMR